MIRISRKSLIALFIILLISMTVACSKDAETVKEDNKPSESNQESTIDTIKIIGLESGEEAISIDEILNMEAITKEMESISSSGEINKNKVKGVLLEDILKSYGTSQKNYGGIRFQAGDGYSIVVPKEILQIRDIVLAYEIDDEPLDKKSLPLRVTIPDERSMYWVRNLSQIELLQEEIITVDRVFFLETAVASLTHEDYTYYESTDKAVKGIDIINNYSEDIEYEGMFFKAVDGLEKKEKTEVFKTGYIKVTGKDIPLFLSPDLPKGMHIKNILWFSHGNTAYFSLEKGFEKFELKEIDGHECISLKDISKEIDLQSKPKYLFKAEDGYEVEIEAADFDKGYIYINSKGNYTLAFEGLPKNTKVKGILSIEAIK